MAENLMIGPMPEEKQRTFYFVDEHNRITRELPLEDLWQFTSDSMRQTPEDLQEGEE
jgi:hypothetical protein